MFTDKQIGNIKGSLSNASSQELKEMKIELEARIRVNQREGYKHWEDADSEVLDYISEELKSR